MNLYLLDTDNYKDTEFDGFVIRADTELHAREIANGIDKRWTDSVPRVWLNTALSTCIILTTEGGKELILSSFNAG